MFCFRYHWRIIIKKFNSIFEVYQIFLFVLRSIYCWLFIKFDNVFVSPNPEPPVIILYGWSGIYGHFGLFCFIFIGIIMKIDQCLYCFTILSYLTFSFLPIRSLFVPYVYVSIESIDCIVLLSFELKAILLNSSVKILWLLLLNLCGVFNINLLFFINSSK